MKIRQCDIQPTGRLFQCSEPSVSRPTVQEVDHNSEFKSDGLKGNLPMCERHLKQARKGILMKSINWGDRKYFRRIT